MAARHAQGQARHLTPELACVLAAVRSYFQPGWPLAAREGIDWPRVVELAERHAVVPLLDRALHTTTGISTEVLENLRTRTLIAAQFDLLLNRELASLLQLLGCERIPVIVLKGPVLRAILYGDAALRTCTDLDLLVDPRDVVRTKKLFEARGLRLESVVHWQGEDACLRGRDSEVSFYRSSDEARVDLHWRLLPGYFPRAFDQRELWKDLRLVPVASEFAPTLPPERLLLFLCAHGTKHLWDRLGWICDVARFLQVETGLDWDSVLKQAARSDTTRTLLLGLRLASELLGAELPPSIAPLAADPMIGALAAAVQERMAREIPAPTAMESARFSLRAFERLHHRARFIFGIFFVPTEAEYISRKLPPALYGLYYLYRPLRLAAKYLR